MNEDIIANLGRMAADAELQAASLSEPQATILRAKAQTYRAIQFNMLATNDARGTAKTIVDEMLGLRMSGNKRFRVETTVEVTIQ